VGEGVTGVGVEVGSAGVNVCVGVDESAGGLQPVSNTSRMMMRVMVFDMGGIIKAKGEGRKDKGERMKEQTCESAIGKDYAGGCSRHRIGVLCV
jgi:hypothetical protein